MTTTRPQQCLVCVHFRSPLDEGVDVEQSCDAFPTMIPDDIWHGRADHRKAYPGDGGIRWEPLDDSVEFPELMPPGSQ